MTNEQLKKETRTAAEYIRQVHCARQGEIAAMERKAGLSRGYLHSLLCESTAMSPGLAVAKKLRRHVDVPTVALQQMHRPVCEVMAEDGIR